MPDNEPDQTPARHVSETILWAWLFTVAIAGVVGAFVFFFLTYF
jgi:phosphate/sulfate permease